MAVVVAATACTGHDEAVAQARRAVDAPEWVLTALGAKPGPLTGAITAPSESTLRRALAGVDAADLQRLTAGWVQASRAGDGDGRWWPSMGRVFEERPLVAAPAGTCWARSPTTGRRDQGRYLRPVTLFLVVLMPVVVALIAASALLYSKWLDRTNEVEARHSEAREDAYDRLLAAGDAAWYYRTKKTVDPESADSTLTARMGDEANELFHNGLDRLKDHSRDYDAQLAALESWYTVAFMGTHVGAKSFENTRDGIINLRRREIGLRKRIDEFRELSFYERLLSGHIVQRLPEGIDSLITTTDGEFVIQGSGEEFAQVLIDMVNHGAELKESRERAWLRLADWRDRKIWKAPAD